MKISTNRFTLDVDNIAIEARAKETGEFSAVTDRPEIAALLGYELNNDGEYAQPLTDAAIAEVVAKINTPEIGEKLDNLLEADRNDGGWHDN